ncbi:MAG: glycyl-radical enzyme activating protein [Clostridiales Family XIII bacterium]|jgi:pyruvate formate lyase activating enzyme|nr:glycyl-radical enzyme activating protein [Clostridiales Family XIII bacterium]
MSGVIFNIQRYSLHDGEGIRTVVFLKGCPLRCRWCCNPESQLPQPEISYVRQKCIGSAGCGFCAEACERGAVTFCTDGKAAIDRSKCDNCLRCAGNCPSKAIRAEGRSADADEILDTAEQDAVFYAKGGGLTVSGGEPIMQGDFLTELLQNARRRRLNAAMETCGFGDYAILRQAASLLDMVLYDIKSLDPGKHKLWTGQDNALILDNFSRLCADYPGLPKWVRTPVLPGFNDGELGAIRDFALSRPNVRWEALPYHSFGAGKYAALGREYGV